MKWKNLKKQHRQPMWNLTRQRLQQPRHGRWPLLQRLQQALMREKHNHFALVGLQQQWQNMHYLINLLFFGLKMNNWTQWKHLKKQRHLQSHRSKY